MMDDTNVNESLKQETERLRRVRKAVTFSLCVALLVLMVLNGFYTLDTGYEAVITTFGQAETVAEPGLHCKIPFIQHCEKVDVTIKGMAIGYDIDTNEDILSESIMISSDYNFLNVDFYLTYQVSDPVKYTYASDNPIDILKSSAQAAIRTTIASYKVDSILTTGKGEIQNNIKTMLMDNMDNLDIGISVKSVTIQDSEPPTELVKTAFQAVEDARQGKEKEMNSANKYRNEQLPAMEATVNQIIQNAEAQKEKRIAEAQGQVARFNAMYEEYTKYPLITKERMFYETMEEVLPDMKIVIQGNGSDMQTIYPVDKFAGADVSE